MGFEKLYNYLPIYMQNFVCNLKGIQINSTRYNAAFDKTLRDFCNRSSWAKEQINAYRDDKIRNLVKHCFETVPFYREHLIQYGLNPGDIKGIEDLKKLPIINKSIVLKNREKFLSSKRKKYKNVHMHTSGTTGAGFRFITTEESIHAQWATFWRLYINSGIVRSERQGNFGGQMIVPANQIDPPFWRYINSQNRVYFSAYHEKEANLEYYYEEIKKSKITWINGYPSLIALLADYMIRHGLSNPGVKFVTTGAENLYGMQELQIKKAFKGAVFLQVYGQSENVAFFSQEGNGNIWVDEDAAAVEFIENEFGSYNIIGTNLYNYAMPLIRYSTGDRANYVVEEDGRRRVTKIDGRSEDYVVLPSGEKLGKLDTAFKDAVNVSESQIYQKKDYSIVIKVVLKSSVGKKEVEMAKYWLETATKKKVPISVDYVETIERTGSQKLRYVISEIANV